MANIIFYPYSLINGNMTDATIDSSPAAATGFPVNNLLDRSVDLTWKANANAAAYVFQFDLGAARDVDHIILGGHDLKTQFAGNDIVLKSFTADDYATGSVTHIDEETVDTEPHFIFAFTSAEKRWWELTINWVADSVVPTIGTIFLGEALQATTFQSLGDSVGQSYSNNINPSSSGRNSSILNRKPRNIWNLNWDFMSETFRTNLQTVHLRTLGSHYPLFIADDEGTLFFVRLFPTDGYTPTRSGFQIYSQGLTIIQEDFVDFADGDGITVR